MSNVDVVVVGAGPVGLAAALGLVRSGVRVTVIDKAPGLNDSPRAMAYLYPTLPGLERLGVLADLEAIAFKGMGAGFLDMETGELFLQDATVLEGHVPYAYALQLGQGDVGRVLLRHLADHGVEVLWGSPVTALSQDEEGITVTCDGPHGPQEIRAGWVVGADGASSGVRELLGVGFPGFTWPDRFVSTNIRYDFKAHGLANDAVWRIDPEYGAVIARIGLDPTLWRYTFRESDALPVEGLEERIHEHYRHGLYGGDYELVQFAPYRMHQRCVASFRHGRVLLAGDAAHVTNPCGGLGLTGGFMDAFVLYEALAAVIHGQANEVVLDLYAARRKEVYVNIVSPTASAIKTMMFDPPEGEAKRHMLDGLRATCGNEESMRAFMLQLQALATPSVLPSKEGV